MADIDRAREIANSFLADTFEKNSLANSIMRALAEARQAGAQAERERCLKVVRRKRKVATGIGIGGVAGYSSRSLTAAEIEAAIRSLPDQGADT